ncbi:3-hydroxyisobutyrate dehydrogenase-like protein [Burkholderiales bacterium]|jgi:3-hydroxyisobutyrate dehydrogenase|nr:3-hydroxyisobutyrate dehydrogenase-like protein [Burkholderiales bacterium]
MNIGIVGTGRMGTAIVRRLLDLGHDVQVWNRTAYKAHDAHEAGAKWTPILRDLVRDSDVVISFLYDNESVERVYLGANGLLTGRVEGRLFIDMSTVSPGPHAQIAVATAARGADFLECPVSGSIPAAQLGALVGFAGGEATVFTRAHPLLAQLCRRLEHVGPIGAGARMKLAANLLLAVFWQALGESLLLAGSPSMDTARVIDLLADSNIGAAILRMRATQIVAALNGQTSAPATFDVDAIRKDLRYMVQEAAERGNSLPLVTRALECFDRASSEGGGRADSATYPALWISQQVAPVEEPRGMNERQGLRPSSDSLRYADHGIPTHSEPV